MGDEHSDALTWYCYDQHSIRSTLLYAIAMIIASTSVLQRPTVATAPEVPSIVRPASLALRGLTLSRRPRRNLHGDAIHAQQKR